MLKEKIVIVDVNKKSKIVSEVLPPTLRKPSIRKYDWSARAPSARSIQYFLHKQARGKKDGREWALKEVLQDRRYKNRQLSIIARVEHCNIVAMREYFLKLVRDVLPPLCRNATSA